ncbi:hypothetical protein [Maritalea porphyrae]|uniref:hypothetical protein n=1 Tax=Maritalea porphyrae TaxID=880732 RepID=UPI0022AFE92B|nr:hypothetical protein [Maritalea porphyrae]MCZ4270784.1 hypothetical protein [Maritalea porphyrae]
MTEPDFKLDLGGNKPPLAVAWRVKDFADGWILFTNPILASDEATLSSGKREALYTAQDVQSAYNAGKAENGWEFDVDQAKRDGTKYDFWVEMESGLRRRFQDCYWSDLGNDWKLNGEHYASSYPLYMRILAYRLIDLPNEVK